MLFSLIFAVALAAAVFVSARSLGNSYINRIYLSAEEKEKRELSYVSELQGFVDDNALTSNDSPALAQWARNYRYLYVMIHKDDMLLFESPDYNKGEEEPPLDDPSQGDGDTPPDSGEDSEDKEQEGGNSGEGGGIIVDRPTREELIKYAEERGSHPLRMEDGIVLVSMAEFTEYLYYNVVNVIAIVLAVLVLVAVIMLYFHRLTGRITRLASDVNEVALTDMNKPIRADGKDEIAGLSENVENMRSSILNSLAKEREAMNANTQLITALSHDVRTPLTVLLGYIDVMKGATDDPKMQEYLRASESTAIRLKEMSDDLFNYFLIFGRGSEGVEWEEVDAVTLLDQIFSEYGVILREKGYALNIKADLTADHPLTVRADIGKLTRIFGNLFSNILKYADAGRPVEITAELSDDSIIINISNGISRDATGAESNGIGLRTCAKLAELMELKFRSEARDEVFTATVTLPTVRSA